MLADKTPTSTQVEDLLNQLLTCLAHNAPIATPGEQERSGQEVVLDLCLDGSRYTLTRIKPLLPPAEHGGLSPREKEIIRLVCAGLPNKAISEVLEISPWTVGTYLKRIFAKLHVGSRAEMVARVLQEGLLEQKGRVMCVAVR